MTEDEFKNSVLRNEKRLYLIALSFYKNPYDAEDAVQNTFYKLWKSKNSFENTDHMDKWLTRVCVNECRHTLLLRSKRQTVDIEEAVIPYFDKPKDLDVFRAVRSLSKNERVVIHLYYYEDLTVKEIASLLVITQNAIKTRLSRARRNLKKILGEDWNNE